MQAQLIKDASLEMNAESYGFTFVKKKIHDNYCYLQA